MADRKKKRGKKQPLLENQEEDGDGKSNPGLDSDTEAAYQAFSQTEGESSTAELIEDAGHAESLKKDLKTKHRRKLKELSQLRSPQDDLAGEMKTVKKRSRQKLNETAQKELEDQKSALAGTSTEDGTVPMPEDGTVEEETITTTSRITEQLKIISETTRAEESALRNTGESIDSTGETLDKTGETPASTMTRTPRGSSVRERLRSRIAKAKEKAENEIRDEAREERKRIKDERVKKATRFDKEYDEEEMERLLEEKSKLLKSRRQKMEQLGESGDRLPTPEEAFDFFTRDWDPEPEIVEEEEVVKKEEKPKKAKKKQKEGTSKEGEEEEEGEKKEEEGEQKDGEEEEEREGEEDRESKKEDEDEEEKEADESKPEEELPLIDEFPHDDEGIGPIAFRKSYYIPRTEKQESDDKLLFIPSVISLPANEKIDEEKMPRYLEEEGFYVGVRPSVANRNLNRMENRLLHEPDKGRRWFGEDGCLITLPDPLKKHPSRPVMTDEPEPHLETIFRKAIMRDFDCRYIDGAIDGSGRYQLDVDINSIAFSHHHLFSREHVLATKLTDLYQEYVARKKKNMTEFLTEKIKALKNSSVHLHEYILNHKGEMAVTDRDNYEKRLQDYKYDIRQTRISRDKEEELDRALIKNIIHTWKELKSLREVKGYNNTPVKLQVIKEETNKANDQLFWKQEIEDEVNEIKEEYEEMFQKQMAIYKEDLERYEKQQAAKKDAKKRNKKRRRGSKHSTEADADADNTYQEMTPEDRDLLNEEDLIPPVLPEKFDIKLQRDKIKAKAMAIRRRPGEPKLYPELTSTATVTPTNLCPRGEQQRRDDISNTKVFIKILFNNKEVSRSPAKPLSQDFRVTFGQIYNLKIVQWPESIKFQIYESRGLGNTLLADLYAGIPDPSVTSHSVQLEEIDFSTDLKLDTSHEGVGSGIPFTFDVHGTNTIILMTTGILCSSVSWSVGDDGSPLVPPTSGLSSNNIYNAMKMMDPVAAIGASGIVNLDRLAEWFKQSRLDPNDPNNADLVFMLGSKSNNNMQLRDFFRLEQLQLEFDFTTEDEINHNKRFKLLSFRDNEIPEFKNCKMVPVYEREIPRDMFSEYERKQREEERIKDTEDIEAHRAAVNRFMQRVREQVMRRFRMAAHQKRLEDVVIEEVVPNIGIVFTRLLHFGEPRRPLKPIRKERKKVTSTAVRGEEVKILLNIIRASSVPVRKAAVNAAPTRDHDLNINSLSGVTLVRPYIEVMFQRKTVRTNVGDGPNPSFNEELELPLNVPNDDYSASSLQSMNDIVYINLFDEVIVDMLEDDRDKATSVHQRLEKKWLGSLEIPFSTIYINAKIDGTFRLNTPPVMLGYVYEDSIRRSEIESVLTRLEHNTYISMFLTIEPQLLTPEPVRERFSTNEDEKLLLHAERWQQEMTNRYPKRIYKSSVIDVNGKNVFITRYFKPINLPDDIKDLNLSPEATAERVAHYVSMIPFVSDTVVFPGLCDIWSTCDQFLRMLAGDEEEHAVLLMNYFLKLGKKAFLLIGSAIPEGPTAYVLTEEGNDYWLWNASTGEHFSYRDSYCPVQVVGCIMNHENVWGNVQFYEKPVQMEFNIFNTSNWRPIFGRSYPSPILGSIQPEALHYVPTDKKHAEDLQEKIEQHLKNKIMDWRSRTLTRWNRHCTKIMRKLLPVLEENTRQEINQQNLLQELENSFAAYKVSGFPMNMPFVDLEKIVEAVYSTGVHTQESAEEFALAVYIHAYNNSVLSVWVYVASLTK